MFGPIIYPALSSLVILLFCAFPASAEGTPKVAVSIAPLWSLAAQIMDGVGEPELILTGSASPHQARLSMSSARKLAEAKVIFYVGEGLETFLTHPLETLGNEAVVVQLIQTPGLMILPYASHDDEDHHHESSGSDPHIWLNPRNALLMAEAMATTLAQVDPAHAKHYEANLKTLKAALTSLDDEFFAMFKKPTVALSDSVVPYVVYHDAYHYFMARYQLPEPVIATVTLERGMSAKHLHELQEQLKGRKIRCIISEPGVDSAKIAAQIGDAGAKQIALAPDGSMHPPSPDGYFVLMREIASAFAGCVS